ncbi:MAG: heme exporter protein CcmD [Nitratireductor sp.]
MLDIFGKHAAYIVPSYVATLLVLLGLVVWIRVKYNAYNQELELLKSKGIKRASSK